MRLNRKTVNALYQRFRLLITWQRMNQRREFGGVVEVDESYFGPSRVRGSARCHACEAGEPSNNLSSASLNAKEKFTPKSSRIVPRPRCGR